MNCLKLLDKFRYPYEMMPVIYVILKDAKGDFEEASKRIYGNDANIIVIKIYK